MSEVVGIDPMGVARDRVVGALRARDLVVLPTDSVYGLAADAFAKSATQRIFGAKRRGRRIPLAVLIRGPRQTTGLVEEISEAAERLMAAYWPGPLTLVFRAADGLTWDIGDNAGSVSLRMPTDELLLSVIAEIGPVAVTSANRQGQPVPVTVADAQEQLGDSVSLYVDGGERSGRASTVVDVTGQGAEVLREGAIQADAVQAVSTGAVGWGLRPEAEEGS